MKRLLIVFLLLSGVASGQKLFKSKKDKIIEELNLENKKLKDDNSYLSSKKLSLEYELEAKVSILQHANNQIQKLEEELKKSRETSQQKEKYISALENEIRNLRRLLAEKNIQLPATSITNETNSYYKVENDNSTLTTDKKSSSSTKSSYSSSSYHPSSRSYSSSSSSSGGCSTSQCTATTKKGSRCKRMTTNCSGRCWQH
jgi:NAD-specific glutamate dehydrogenase